MRRPGCHVRTSFRGARLRRVPGGAADLKQRQRTGRQVRLADDDHIFHVYIAEVSAAIEQLTHLLLKRVGCGRVCCGVHIESTSAFFESASRVSVYEISPAHKTSSVEAYSSYLLLKSAAETAIQHIQSFRYRLYQLSTY